MAGRLDLTTRDAGVEQRARKKKKKNREKRERETERGRQEKETEWGGVSRKEGI